MRDFQLHALKIESKNLSPPTFFSNHPETFRICSRDHLEEMRQTEFLDRPFIKKIFDFGNLEHQKNHQKSRSKIFKIEYCKNFLKTYLKILSGSSLVNGP